MTTNIDRVNFQYDGLALTPHESIEMLAGIQKTGEISGDYYSNGGVVELLEQEMAAVLGKERAIFMPSGTLANHIAIRNLAGPDMRVLVQEKSHIYNDSGDCLQGLSGVNLIPLKSLDDGNAGYTAEQVESCISDSAEGKVRTEIGVISIESPVRRMNGMVVPQAEIKRVVGYAKENGIRTHLDGARLFIAAAYAGMTAAEYAMPFDTVYVSLYKYFNAPFGAILAGTDRFIEGLYHQRRMFGGGLNEAWMPSALALHSLGGFELRYKKVIMLTTQLITALNELETLFVEPLPHGTNVYRMVLDETVNTGRLKTALLDRNIVFPDPESRFNGFYFKTNESLINQDLEKLTSCFKDALELSVSS
jgi:threonine aldolase